MGGGLKQFGQARDYAASWDDSCVRGDGRDLVAAWLEARSERSTFVRSREDLLALNVNEIDRLLGLFAPGHMPFALETNVTDYSRPSLAEMTLRAVQLLSKAPDGFVLLVSRQPGMAPPSCRVRAAATESDLPAGGGRPHRPGAPRQHGAPRPG